MIEHRDLRKQLERLLLILIVLIAVSYGTWKAYPLLAGPSVTIFSPLPNALVSSTTFIVSGKVARVKEITLQGRPIPIDKEGMFNELLTAQAPHTTIVLTATDFYGKTVTRSFNVIPEK